MRTTIITICSFIIFVFLLTSSSTAYSYNDYFDILIHNNKIASDWVMKPESSIPPELKKYAIIGNINNDGKENQYLVPLKLLIFNNDGTFTYLWVKNSENTEHIEGEWAIIDSMLILTLKDDSSPSYKKDSELRYRILRITNDDTSLQLGGTNYPGIPELIKTSNNPIEDLSKIAASIENR